jgi:hypothetical protein
VGHIAQGTRRVVGEVSLISNLGRCVSVSERHDQIDIISTEIICRINQGIKQSAYYAHA